MHPETQKPRQTRLTPAAAVAVAAGLILCALLVYYALCDPADGAAPRCPFLILTGYQCPGCGSQRALHALLTGHPVEALGFNPFLILAIPALVVFALAESPLGRRRYPRFSAAMRSRPAALTLAALIMVWWVIRNLSF